MHEGLHPRGARRRLALLALAVALTAGAPPAAAAPAADPAQATVAEAQSPRATTLAYLQHRRTGLYQAFGLLARDWRTPYELDPAGVPIVEYPFGRFHNPTTSAQYALANWSLWVRYGDRSRLLRALRVADWLVVAQHRPSGAWAYEFDYWTPGGSMLSAPWPSALAQGQAISLLRRAYAHTGERKYLLAARRGLRPLRHDVSAGGVRRHWRGSAFYEEYPTRPAPLYVLNGFMQSLLGLYDLADVSPVARRLFAQGMRTLPRIVPRYDHSKGRSSYSLAHRGSDTGPVAATPSYHLTHVGMLRLLDRIQPSPILRRYVVRWSKGLASG